MQENVRMDEYCFSLLIESLLLTHNYSEVAIEKIEKILIWTINFDMPPSGDIFLMVMKINDKKKNHKDRVIRFFLLFLLFIY
jgi:hypothetical protein